MITYTTLKLEGFLTLTEFDQVQQIMGNWALPLTSSDHIQDAQAEIATPADRVCPSTRNYVKFRTLADEFGPHTRYSSWNGCSRWRSLTKYNKLCEIQDSRWRVMTTYATLMLKWLLPLTEFDQVQQTVWNSALPLTSSDHIQNPHADIVTPADRVCPSTTNYVKFRTPADEFWPHTRLSS